MLCCLAFSKQKQTYAFLAAIWKTTALALLWRFLAFPGASWRSMVFPGAPWCSLCSLTLPLGRSLSGAPSLVLPGALPLWRSLPGATWRRSLVLSGTSPRAPRGRLESHGAPDVVRILWHNALLWIRFKNALVSDSIFHNLLRHFHSFRRLSQRWPPGRAGAPWRPRSCEYLIAKSITLDKIQKYAGS